MKSLDEIKKPIDKELTQFEAYYKKSLNSSTPLLNKILRYSLSRKGKQIRPLFVLLSGKMFGEINEKTYQGATFIELLHEATLIHDDVVDDSSQRRGLFSLNALWKNKIAVLVGDYLLSKGMIIALENKDYDMLEIISEAVKVMSEGEIYQMEKARCMDITEDDYFDIIERKTAAMISACCSIGAFSTNASADNILKMKSFGMNVGIAFQIRDDIFDFQKDNKTGKPAGNDIKEHKMTLPLINLINQCDRKEKNHIIRIIKHHGDEKKTFDEILEKMEQCRSLDYAKKKMEDYTQKALNQLDEFENTEASEAMKDLVEYCILRNR